jgi:hypothetical protein
MNCQQFEQLAPQIAHSELRDAELLQNAAIHAASCAACSAILTEAHELAATVAALAVHDKSIGAPVQMESTLRAAFVRQHAATAPLHISSSRNVFVGATFRWAALSLAAAIIFAILFLPRVISHKPETNRAVIAPTQTPAPVVTQQKSAPLISPAPSAASKHLASFHKPKTNSRESETTLTGFLALPYADDFSSIENGAIVRLQLSRADLAWLGLPVPITDTGAKTVADLLVNGNGVPEAIRLVR